MSTWSPNAVRSTAAPDASYAEFIAGKLRVAPSFGHEVEEAQIAPLLFPFQRAIVRWAVHRGRAAIFAECGLGKTLMQLEWARLLGAKTLILTPLAVAEQTVAEARKLGLEARYVRGQAEITTQISVTNYEMLDAFDPSAFGAVVLDESSILKSFAGKTKRRLIEAFAATPYRLCCTATPAPNDHMELGNHADFLGVMASNEMLARWFINDTMAAGNYRLKAHGRDDFWRWIASWAACAARPSDVGAFSDEGFALPPLQVRLHSFRDQQAAQDRGRLFVDGALSATEIWKDKKRTAAARCTIAASLVTDEGPWIVWCDTNDESERLAAAIPGSVEVRGSDSVKEKSRKLADFSSGASRVIVTKADIAGFGLNWQHCSNMIFVGLTYSFEKVYQALRRSYRFGQKSEVTAHFVVVESEGGVLDAFERKRHEHEAMQRELVDATKRFGIDFGKDSRMLTDVETDTQAGDGWVMYLGDCVATTRQLADNTIDFSVFSPPFSNLYIYSASIADMGNSADHAEFFKHFDFLIGQLLRVTKPGRLCAVHCKDLPLYMNRDGASGLYDFPGEIVRRFSGKGWTFHSRVTIWKDPVTEMQRTKNHGLLHKNFTTRREVCRQGMADFVLVFRAWKGEEIPDGQIQGMPKEYIGDEPPTNARDERDYSIQVWQRYASPVWFDVQQQRVLQYRNAKGDEDERHICPLQLDVIERCLELWSNPGDLVLSPFAGIGSEGHCAVKRGRRFVGIELKREYFDMACKNLAAAALSTKQQGLFAEKKED